MFLKDIVELVVAPKNTDGTLPILEWKLAEHRATAVNHSKFQVVTKTWEHYPYPIKKFGLLTDL